MHRSRGAINLLWQQRLAYALNSGGVASPLKRMGPALQMHSASSPPPPMASTNESYLSGSNSAYVDEMYDSWARDPTSVHASWDAYFRGINYTPPPALGMYLQFWKSRHSLFLIIFIGNTRANEVPLSALAPALAGGAAVGGAGTAPSAKVIDAHLAVQTTIRSYQVRGHLGTFTNFFFQYAFIFGKIVSFEVAHALSKMTGRNCSCD